MKCVICKTGETRPGTASVVLERAGTTLLIRDVPGEICDTCGEVYHDAEITQRLLAQAERAYHDGVDVEVRRYNTAA